MATGIGDTEARRGHPSRRALAVIWATGFAVAMTAATASAQAATYSGKVKGVPGAEITVVFKREAGGLYLDQYSWGQVPWTCDNGMESVGLSGGYHPPDGRVSDRRFRIRNAAPENDFVGLLSGKFNRERTRVSGELRYKGQHHDPSYGVCDTGKLEWKAEKVQ